MNMFNLFKSAPKEYNDIDAAEFAQLMKQPNHVVLDVRSPFEQREGAIPGNILIDMFDPAFAQKVAKLDKSKTYMVYCRSGNRSKTACSLMARQGFENLYNLKGGIYAWKSLQEA
tara:strand:+ start:53 stop:397 length:345 start_codon:yes stop_codon:yes gene_type:complete